ncbi:hypothetical protein GCM10025883_35820 [Mobilicoccus caccae]|uniref:Uncharacterized protein n=1 Tax=Mobilicoccus caccae TaxID=1859295 RepID=A0ABQ6IWK9_9MICO|nr:hypothetical protein GCM10025883_35820 [Mobilicoccus caccae]
MLERYIGGTTAPWVGSVSIPVRRPRVIREMSLIVFLLLVLRLPIEQPGGAESGGGRWCALRGDPQRPIFRRARALRRNWHRAPA